MVAICLALVLGQAPAAFAQESPDPAALTAYEAAAALQGQQLFDLAANEWQAMLTKHSQGSLARRARHNLAVCRFHQQQLTEAEADFAAVTRVAENQALLESALANLGLTRFNLAIDQAADESTQQAWLEKAVPIFERLLKEFPKSTHAASSRFYCAEAFSMLNQHAKAAKTYEGVLADADAKAFHADALYGQAVSQIALGEAAAAMPSLAKLVNSIETEQTLRSRTYEQRGIARLQLNQFAKAADDFKAAASLVDAQESMTLAELASQRAFALYRAEDYAAAAVAYGEAASLYTRLPAAPSVSQPLQEAQLAAGKCWLLAGDAERAAKELAPVWKSNPVVSNAESACWLAQAQLKTDAELAVTTAEQALKTMPADPLAADLELAYGKALLEANDGRDNAIRVLTALFERSPATEPGQQAGYLASRACFETGQTDEASRMIQKLLSQAELPRPEWRQLAAEMAIDQSQWQQATEQYRQLLADDPTNPAAPQWRLRLAETLVATDSWQEASLLLEQAVETLDGPSQTTARLELARVKLNQDAPQAALQTLVMIPDSDARTGEAAYLRGLALQAMQQPEQAASAFKQSIDEKGAFAENALYELAWLKQEAAPAESVALFRSLINDYPNSPLLAEAWYRIAESQYADQDYANAASSFRSAAEAANVNGSHAHAADDSYASIRDESLHFCGWSWLEAKQFDKAKAAFQDQLIGNPRGQLAGDAQWLLGECDYEAGRYAEALKAYQAAQALPTQPGLDLASLTSLHAGQAAAQMGAWRQSLDWLTRAEKVLTIAPSENQKPSFSVAARMEEITYEKAWALSNLNRRDEARPLFEQLSKEATNQVLSARATFMVGELLFADEAYAKAVRTFFKVAYGYGGKNAPEPFHTWQAESLFEAARCLEQLGRVTPARKLYVELIERFPESEKAKLARDKLRASNA